MVASARRHPKALQDTTDGHAWFLPSYVPPPFCQTPRLAQSPTVPKELEASHAWST